MSLQYPDSVCLTGFLVCVASQAVVNLDNVKSVPGLGKVASLPFVTQVLQGILPSIGECTAVLLAGWVGGWSTHMSAAAVTKRALTNTKHNWLHFCSRCVSQPDAQEGGVNPQQTRALLVPCSLPFLNTPYPHPHSAQDLPDPDPARPGFHGAL